jgi:nicotinate-nucleotide adenylyltransferase
MEMVFIACEQHFNMRAIDIEFKLPQPNYTIDTLVRLEEKFPKHAFTILMGGDNLQSLPKWKNYSQILKNYPIYVYNRPGSENFPDLKWQY